MTDIRWFDLIIAAIIIGVPIAMLSDSIRLLAKALKKETKR